MQWLHQAGAALLTINREGEVVLTSAPAGPDHPRLRRAQALAAQGPLGLDLTRALLAAKLRGQAAALESVSHDATALYSLAEAIGYADSLSAARLIEAQAAALYWGALESVSFPWNRQDAKLVPSHWGTIGPRSSPLTHSPRRAVTPAHAILNYAYALLEAETRLACLAVGLDPGLGLLHADQQSRDSLALDLMEAVRPTVDRWWLGLLQRQVFGRRDFSERGPGEVRCTLALKPNVAETVGLWRQAIAPWAEWCAASLTAGRALAVPGDGARERLGIATHLTGHNRSLGRDGTRKRAVGTAATAAPKLDRRLCQGCGLLLSADGRRAKQAYCAECRELVREEALSHFQAAGPATLAQARAAGRDPSHTEVAQAKRRTTKAERAKERAAWEAQTRAAPLQDTAIWFDILAGLAPISLGAMRRATGLSLAYCAQIKRGRVPHAMHWAALTQLVTTCCAATSGGNLQR